jgi:hypothetical protein
MTTMFKSLLVMLAALLTLCVAACTPSASPTSENNTLVSTSITETVWVKASYDPQTDITTYRPETASFRALDETGFCMKSGGEYVSYANSSFCGTPPVINAEFSGGSWRATGANQYTIAATFWMQGKLLNSTMEIVEQGNGFIKVKSTYLPN